MLIDVRSHGFRLSESLQHQVEQQAESSLGWAGRSVGAIVAQRTIPQEGRSGLNESHPQVGDWVRLLRDVPELLVRRGELGIVCSIWFSPDDAYELELGGEENPKRILTRSGDINVENAKEPADVATPPTRIGIAS